MEALRSIEFRNVTRDLVDRKKGRLAVLQNVTATLSADANLAVVGSDVDVLLAFLHLVAGSDLPERGVVDAKRLRFSPILNAGGGAATLVPQISVIDNIKFFARLHAANATKLVEIVDQVCRLGPLMNGLVRTLDRNKRRAVEIATIAALPYDCYLIDRFDTLMPEYRWLMAHSVRAREAGMIFATQDMEVAAEFGTDGVLVENGKLHTYKNPMPAPVHPLRSAAPRG